MSRLFWQNVNFVGLRRTIPQICKEIWAIVAGQRSLTTRRLDSLVPIAVGGLRRILFSLVAGLMVLGWSAGAIAGPLAERLAQFPNWEARPPVQAAAGDLYYPDWFRGTWDVTTALVDLAAPLAPTVTTPGFEQNRRFLHQPIPFQARFIPVDRPLLPRGFGVLGQLPTASPVVADRAFNGLNLARAYLDESADVETSRVVDVRVDPTNPNRQLTVLQGDRRLISTISARATETPTSDEFVTSEIFQQEFRRSNQLYLNQVETTTRYTHHDSTQANEPSITAEQVTAIYLAPQDPEFEQAGDRPVALYRYSLDFFPATSS
ncbi:MAG: DUF6816 family protein [Cyanobacteria bacterium J06638_20]